MKNINKYVAVMTAFTIFLSGFTSAFAGGYDNEDFDQSQVEMILPSGQVLPLAKSGTKNEEMDKLNDTIYLYEVTDSKSELLDLGVPFGIRNMAYGQFQYLERLDNSIDGVHVKNNLDRLKTVDGMNAAKLLPQNNNYTQVGKTYKTVMGYTYPEGDNHSWKSRTSGSEEPDPSKQFYFNGDAENLSSTSWNDQLGNFRYTLNQIGDRVGAKFFPNDKGKSGLRDFSGWNLMPTPWNDSFLVVEGYQNKQFLQWLNTYAEKSGMQKIDSLDASSEKIYNLAVNAFEQDKLNDDWSGILYIYHTAVSKKGIYSMEKTLAKLARKEFGDAYSTTVKTVSQSDDSVDAYNSKDKNDNDYSRLVNKSWESDINTTSWDEKEIMEMVVLFKYFSVHDLGGHGYSQLQSVHKATDGGLRYATSTAPREYSSYDLISGKTPEGNYIGDNQEFRMRVREYNPDTGEYGDILYQDVDTLQIGKTYIVEWFTGFRKIEKSSRTDSKGNPADFSAHSNIMNYINVAMNDDWDNKLEEADRVEGYKVFLDENDIPQINYDEFYNTQMTAYNHKEGLNELNDIEGVIGYKKVFTVPEIDTNNQPVAMLNINASIPNVDNWYKGSDINTNDNADTGHDNQWGYYQVAESTEDFYVAHMQNENSPNTIPDLGLDKVDIIEFNGQPYTGQELKPTDKVTFEIYAQRSKESTLEGVAFKDLSMWLEEYPNPDMDLSHYLNSDPLYTTSFNNGDKFTTNAPKITGFKRFDSLTTQHDANWTDYSSSSHQNELVNAGDVVKFELKDYVIPSKDSIINNSSKWNVNHPAIASLSNIEHLSVQFELNVNADKVNPNTGNDWARYNLKVGKPNKRNMYIEEVTVYNEDGRHIQTFKTEGKSNTSFFLNEALEAGKNYYAVPKVKFEFPYDNKRSNTANLELHSVPSYNNYPEEDMANTKFRVYSEMTGYWNDGDVGTYDPTNRSGFNIKTYNPDTDPMNGLVIASKAKTDTKEFNLWIKIPDVENFTNENNLIPDVADQVTIHGTIGSNGKDNEVKDIQLFNQAGDEYATKGENDYQLLDPDLGYYAFITVKRKAGNDDSMIDMNPSLIVNYKTKNSTEISTTTLQPYLGNRLKNVGDEIIYKLDGLVSSTNFISIDATLDVLDTDLSNNSREESWINEYNFFVNDLAISPNKIPMADGVYSINVDHNISFNAGFVTSGSSQTINNVPVVVEEYSKVLNGEWGSPRIVHQEYMTLTNKRETRVSVSINTNYNRHMTKKYVVKINGGETGTQVYKEVIRSDNETHAYTKAYGDDNITLNCTNLRSSNSWNVDHYRTKYSGGRLKSFQTTNSKGKKVTKYYCDPMGTPTDYQVRKSYKEELVLKAMFKATNMDSYVDIIKNPSLGKVRAGEKFDLYLVLSRESNRGEFPWRSVFGTGTFRKYDRKGCNKDIVSPASPYAPVQNPLMKGKFVVSSQQEENYIKYPSSSSSNGYEESYTYAFGTRHIPSDTQNMDMKLYIQTTPIDGYTHDIEHPDLQLKICEAITIKVLGGMPVETGTSVIE